VSFPAYPSYRDSGVDWIGWVPSGWAVEPLKAAYAIVGGATPKSEVADYWDGDVPWVTPGDLSKLTTLFIGETIRTISEEGLAACAASRVPSGSVILSTRAPIGSIGITTEPTTTNQGCKALVPRRGANSSFLAYTLSAATTALNVRGKGTTFLELSGDELGRFNVPTPSIVDQATIAAFLDRETARIDALIEEQQRLIELLKEKRQAVISHAVTKGLDPTAPMKDSGVEWLGEVPAHWEVKPFRYVISRIESGTSVNALDAPASEGELGVLKTSCVYSGEFDPKENKTVILEDIERVSCPLQPRTMIVSRMNTPDLVGAAGLVRDAPSNLYLPDRLWQLHFNGVDAEFIHLWSQTRSYRSQVQVACSGTSSSMQNLSQDNLLSFAFPCPPPHEQAQIIRNLDGELAQLSSLSMTAKAAIELLNERRSALISAAVTGKIDVRGLVEPTLKPEPEPA
jgi:type I restriction enzyme S subunit